MLNTSTLRTLHQNINTSAVKECYQKGNATLAKTVVVQHTAYIMKIEEY